jgi:hypothetical protein
MYSYIENDLLVGLLNPEFGSYFVSCRDIAAQTCD